MAADGEPSYRPGPGVVAESAGRSALAPNEPAEGVRAAALPDLSRLRLDELLSELVERAQQLATTQSRLRALLDAVVAVGSDLSLPVVLQRIVSAACALVDARYAALGVIGSDRLLREFISVGLDEEARARIGRLPQGRGILGLLIEDPRPLRLSELRDHPKAYGFPADHPAMGSFLGVPIRVGGEVFGNLYLTEKRDAEEFSAEDEDLVVALAAAAAVAIDHARRFEGGRRRSAWLEASTEVTSTLLGDGAAVEPLRLVAERARAVAGADVAAVVLGSGDRGDLLLEVAVGHDGDTPLSAVDPADLDLAGRVLRTGEGEVGVTATGSTLAVPLGTPPRVLGALIVVRRQENEAFSPADLQLAEQFGGHAALAVELARAQHDRELLAVYEDRDRIARDLHDLVIQRLFATGLRLQGLGRHLSDPDAHRRLESSVEELDETIREIRKSIFSLTSPADTPGLRAELLKCAAHGAAALGVEPSLRFEGPLDTGVPAPVAEHVVAVVREALSNAAQHAHASRVDVVVTARDRELQVGVADDGAGVTGTPRESGLANLRRRAEELGGQLDIESGPGAGTQLRWCVPLS